MEVLKPGHWTACGSVRPAQTKGNLTLCANLPSVQAEGHKTVCIGFRSVQAEGHWTACGCVRSVQIDRRWTAGARSVQTTFEIKENARIAQIVGTATARGGVCVDSLLRGPARSVARVRALALGVIVAAVEKMLHGRRARQTLRKLRQNFAGSQPLKARLGPLLAAQGRLKPHWGKVASVAP